MEWNREDVNLRIRDLVAKRVADPAGDLAQALGALGLTPHAGTLGTPMEGATWGTGGLSGDELREGLRNPQREIDWRPPNGCAMLAMFCYSTYLEPVKFRVAELDAAFDEGALSLLIGKTVEEPLRRFLARIAKAVGMDWVAAEDQEHREWAGLASVHQALTRGSTYARVDRAAYPQFNPRDFTGGPIDGDHYVWWGPHALRRGAWFFEAHPKYNFQFTGLVPKWKAEEGGEMAEWGQFVAKVRLVCTAPWLNLRRAG